MVKHARTKKRRSARTGRSKLKNRNYQFFKPPQINDDTVRANWNPRKSPAQNMANMGLQTAVNSSIDTRAAIALANHPNSAKANGNKAIELFDIPESDKMNNITMLPGKTFAQRKLPVSIEDQKYIRKCLAKHGDDYHSMMRDIKTNDMQHTESKLRKMAARFYLLAEDHVKVEIPEKVRHLMACCREEKEEK
eukprot:CAMPEP_0183706216 /NCGR_PEP_ID=MMETSP0737-20130205/3108_1 /TAXON_ID=385413 /ORGANISM="Thalassiosira miniscula, Strain CCMP1093" /LENGTH=192 /DNA_ID=CAMNT_0025933571 /DNA_START=81 /DNA_END=659 /DNA_ORIENTATION=+